MPQRTRRNKLNRKNGGGWTQGPALGADQYYLTEYKPYTDCYPMVRPGSIQSNPNPELAQTPMAGGRSRYRGGSNCREYFLTRGGSRKNNKKQNGGCGCMMRGGKQSGGKQSGGKQSGGKQSGGKQSGGSNCREYFLTRGGSRKHYRLKGGRYVVDTGSSIGGTGPNVAPVISNFPCEAYRPMMINPQSSELVSAPESGIHFAGLSPAAVLKGGSRRRQRKQRGGQPLAYNATTASYSFFPNIAQGQTLNPGQIPYNIVVPSDDSAKPCGQAMAQINKA